MNPTHVGVGRTLAVDDVGAEEVVKVEVMNVVVEAGVVKNELDPRVLLPSLRTDEEEDASVKLEDEEVRESVEEEEL